MAGPIAPADATISTSALRRVLKYEPRDLTISVEAGMPWREFTALLAGNRQMVPLDPPFGGEATVGGVAAANTSGPRRRLYGSARDMIIGMSFATLEGKLIQTGGMVVKNVAGLDMAKLMIGSFGTLAAIASVNFRLYPMPAATRSFRWQFSKLTEAIERRDAILGGVLQPMALDLFKDAGGYALLLQAGGSPAVLDRYRRELPGAEMLDAGAEQEAWLRIRQHTPMWLMLNPQGAVVRVSCPLTQVGAVLDSMPAPAIARAGAGVCYGYFPDAAQAAAFAAACRGGIAVIEFAPPSFREHATLWPAPGSDFAIMEKIKVMFDPDRLLNRGRLYGRL